MKGTRKREMNPKKRKEREQNRVRSTVILFRFCIYTKVFRFVKFKTLESSYVQSLT